MKTISITYQMTMVSKPDNFSFFMSYHLADDFVSYHLADDSVILELKAKRSG